MSAAAHLCWLVPAAVASASACRCIVALVGLIISLRGSRQEDRALIYGYFTAGLSRSVPDLVRPRSLAKSPDDNPDERMSALPSDPGEKL